MTDSFVAVAGLGTAHEERFRALTGRLGQICGYEPTVLRRSTFLLATAGGPTGRRVATAEFRHLSCVGQASLDNREELAKRTDAPDSSGGGVDLELALRLFASEGPESFAELSGSFAFVLWDAESGTLWAARDWLGLNRIFVSEGEWGIAISSHLETLRTDDRIDRDYVADYLLSSFPPEPTRTIWKGISPIKPGFILQYRDGASSERVFRSLWSVRPRKTVGQAEAIETFRALFDRAVLAHLGRGEGVWAEVSGGLDSSSIVVTAQHLFECGKTPIRLGGGYTLVDELDREDQRPYFEGVVQRCGLKHREFLNFRPWQADGHPPPKSDEPWYHYAFWASDRAARELVRAGGGEVILGGYGADQYLGVSRKRIADQIVSGRLPTALRTAYGIARQTDTSFWRHLWSSGLAPILGAHRSPKSIPDWIAPGLRERARNVMSARMRGWGSWREVGHRGDHIRRSLVSMRSALEVQPYTDYLERRHPFLYQPLVEFVLSLPSEDDFGGGEPKGLLRHAMHDRLPPVVRHRMTNDSADRGIIWALSARKAALDRMLKEPVLADYGIVDGEKFRDLVDAARLGVPTPMWPLLPLLSLETWLAVRSGKWDPGSRT